jgi:hypothetical protein
MIGEPKYDVVQIKEAYDYLMSLNIDSVDNQLWTCLHAIIWHKGIDRVDWILSNKPLIEEIIKYSSMEPLPEELRKRFWESVERYKRLDR